VIPSISLACGRLSGRLTAHRRPTRASAHGLVVKVRRSLGSRQALAPYGLGPPWRVRCKSPFSGLTKRAVQGGHQVVLDLLASFPSRAICAHQVVEHRRPAEALHQHEGHFIVGVGTPDRVVVDLTILCGCLNGPATPTTKLCGTTPGSCATGRRRRCPRRFPDRSSQYVCAHYTSSGYSTRRSPPALRRSCPECSENTLSLIHPVFSHIMSMPGVVIAAGPVG